jgi:hypothetical protein
MYSLRSIIATRRVPTFYRFFTIMSQVQSNINWNQGSHRGLISIGTHKLGIDVSGPDRQPGQPVVLILHGLTNIMLAWVAARRALAQTARVVDYDRSGLGLSDEGPDKPTATTATRELSALLQAANIEPPYILVAHSWGAVLGLEFMNSRPEDIAGIVFAEGSAPHYFDVLPMFPMVPEFKAVMGDISYNDGIELRGRTKLSLEEYDAQKMFEVTDEKTKRQSAKEFSCVKVSFTELEKKDLLNQKPPKMGNRPVCVIKGNHARDVQMIYDKGVALGNGTEAERERVREVINIWDTEEKGLHESFFGLSSKTRWVDATRTGHWLHHTEPELIAEGVQWILDNLETKS